MNQREIDEMFDMVREYAPDALVGIIAHGLEENKTRGTYCWPTESQIDMLRAVHAHLFDPYEQPQAVYPSL
jgi:hypothetical protein